VFGSIQLPRWINRWVGDGVLALHEALVVAVVISRLAQVAARLERCCLAGQQLLQVAGNVRIDLERDAGRAMNALGGTSCPVVKISRCSAKIYGSPSGG